MIDVNLKKDKLRVSTLGLVIALVYSLTQMRSAVL